MTGRTAGRIANAVAAASLLQGMADRLDAVEGTLQVESSPGAGTTVTGRVPVGAGPSP